MLFEFVDDVDVGAVPRLGDGKMKMKLWIGRLQGQLLELSPAVVLLKGEGVLLACRPRVLAEATRHSVGCRLGNSTRCSSRGPWSSPCHQD